MITLGYRPLLDELNKLVEDHDFTRALVIDDEVSTLWDAAKEVRISVSADVALPAGVYWFSGIEEPLVVEVPVGPTGASAEVTVDSFDDLDAEHPLIEAWRWAEHLWAHAQPVPEPRFDVGARALTVPGGVDVEIRSRSFIASQWSYTVRGPSGLEAVLQSKLEAVSHSETPEDWVRSAPTSAARLGATLTRTKLQGKFADTVYSFQATRTVFRPYQFKPVLKLLQTGRSRLLIADEVGLGKTIEAGLIWTELEARHEADRVLIVCPSALVDKWRDEMQERFGFDLHPLNRPELKRFLELHRDGRLPRRKAYVASLEALRSWDGLDELNESPPGFDLVVVDEAHQMRNSDTKSYQLGTQLSDWTTGSNMVFLTATPINLRQTDLLNLLGLLEPGDFDDVDDLEARLAPNAVLNEVGKRLTDQATTPESFVEILNQLAGMTFEKSITMRPEYQQLQDVLAEAPLSPKQIALGRQAISKLNSLSTTVSRTRRAEVDERKALRDAEPGIKIVWNAAESAFYREFLIWCGARAQAAGTAMYFSMQMPIRLASTSIHIAAESVLSRVDQIWSGDTESDDEPPSTIPPHQELVEAARGVLETADTKLQRLADVLSELHSAGRPALLFTWSKVTLRYLKFAYRDRYRIAVLNGDVPREQRREIMREFRAGAYDFLFANKVASEGLDFEFCSAVINYDLPWNPMEVEQRIGRIDRIGQQSEKILIRNFYNDEAIDSRIMFKVLERIEIFERSIGELEPIVGEHMDLLKSAMDFTLTPDQQEQRAQQFLTAIEGQKTAMREVVDSSAGLMIANDVNIAGLEEELKATGRYLGQSELGHLIDDWAQIDGAEGVKWVHDGKVLEIKGNATMAHRITDIVREGLRTRAETSSLSADLQNGQPLLIALDHEVSRTSGLDLLSANHPLVIAATMVPGHRHARFASVRIPRSPETPTGRYIAVFAHARNATQGGDEIWGAAVDPNGVNLGVAAADALLAALARGEIRDGEAVEDSDALRRPVSRARKELERKHREAQQRREEEDDAFRESRRAILTDQHERRIAVIRQRMDTIIQRDRGESILRMVDGQRRRQEERFQQLVLDLETKQAESISLTYLATCVVEVDS